MHQRDSFNIYLQKKTTLLLITSEKKNDEKIKKGLNVHCTTSLTTLSA